MNKRIISVLLIICLTFLHLQLYLHRIQVPPIYKMNRVKVFLYWGLQISFMGF